MYNAKELLLLALTKRKRYWNCPLSNLQQNLSIIFGSREKLTMYLRKVNLELYENNV